MRDMRPNIRRDMTDKWLHESQYHLKHLDIVPTDNSFVVKQIVFLISIASFLGLVWHWVVGN